jgi:hypothetical protein
LEFTDFRTITATPLQSRAENRETQQKQCELTKRLKQTQKQQGRAEQKSQKPGKPNGTQHINIMAKQSIAESAETWKTNGNSET